MKINNIDRITSGSIPKAIFSLALPVVANMFMEFALSSTDYFWVGKLGATAQDAVTTSMIVTWTIWSLISVITVGITAIVARYLGAKDHDRAAYYIKQGLSMALGMGAAVSLAGFFLTPLILAFMNTSSATLELAVPYLRIFFVSASILFVGQTIYAVFRASGDTRTPTKVGVSVVLLNMVLDPLLIFGVGPFPQLGVTGASLATAVSILAGAIVISAKMLSGRLGYRLGNLLAMTPRLREMLKIARIGAPIASQELVFVIVYWFLIKIVHSFGEEAAAAMGIGNRMESFSYLTCFGFSIAASTLVGQNLGAAKPDRAAKCAWGATGIGIGMTFVISILFIAFPSAIGSIFTNNTDVLQIARDYLIILGLSQITMAVEIILEGSFSGAGDTIPPMVVMIPGSVARIPLAYFLCFTLDWGINGVWWTLTITTTVKAIILALWFKRGKWKEKQV
ncbi:MAG: MATE family efflux transporter [Candidatus Zixiibacteriota bacterium]